MRTSLFVAVFIATASSAAVSQQAGPFQGKWSGSMPGQSENQLGVELEVGDTTGTWRMTPQGNWGLKNPCFKRLFPVTVTSQSTTELRIEINGAKVLQGCMNQSAFFKQVDANTLEGELGDGRLVKLSRN
jgi:hypothetical protein